MCTFMFVPTTFDELIGNKKILCLWKECISNLQYGDIVLIYGYSGTGKTIGTRLLVEDNKYNTLFIDTNISSDGKDILDRMYKFHNWHDLSHSFAETNDTSKKVIIIDEIESFAKIDRNVLNTILLYNKHYTTCSIPIILIGNDDILKKLGSIKTYITNEIKLPRLNDIDIFIYFKKRIPQNKIKLADLMKLIENANGNMYSVVLSINLRLQTKKSLPSYNYVGDEQRSLNEIFQCKNSTVIEKLIRDDDWINPLKIHENIIKVLDIHTYEEFLFKYLYYEVWQYKLIDSIDSISEIPVSYLAFSILSSMKSQDTDGKIDTFDFSKLLSYISTKKKYKKILYDKVPHSYPIEDLGLYWIHNHYYSKKKLPVENIL